MSMFDLYNKKISLIRLVGLEFETNFNMLLYFKLLEQLKRCVWKKSKEAAKFLEYKLSNYIIRIQTKLHRGMASNTENYID